MNTDFHEETNILSIFFEIGQSSQTPDRKNCCLSQLGPIEVTPTPSGFGGKLARHGEKNGGF